MAAIGCGPLLLPRDFWLNEVQPKWILLNKPLESTVWVFKTVSAPPFWLSHLRQAEAPRGVKHMQQFSVSFSSWVGLQPEETDGRGSRNDRWVRLYTNSAVTALAFRGHMAGDVQTRKMGPSAPGLQTCGPLQPGCLSRNEDRCQPWANWRMDHVVYLVGKLRCCWEKQSILLISWSVLNLEDGAPSQAHPALALSVSLGPSSSRSSGPGMQQMPQRLQMPQIPLAVQQGLPIYDIRTEIQALCDRLGRKTCDGMIVFSL